MREQAVLSCSALELYRIPLLREISQVIFASDNEFVMCQRQDLEHWLNPLVFTEGLTERVGNIIQGTE